MSTATESIMFDNKMMIILTENDYLLNTLRYISIFIVSGFEWFSCQLLIAIFIGDAQMRKKKTIFNK